MTISSVGCDPATVNVYDNMNLQLTDELKRIVADLIQTSSKSITINYVKMQYQSGSSDCGLFAIAYACAICHGLDPSNLIYRQDSMRRHLIRACNVAKLTVFPCERQHINTTITSKKMDIFCLCGIPDNNGQKMIMCSTRQDWYHITCVQIPSRRAKRQWSCRKCSR